MPSRPNETERQKSKASSSANEDLPTVDIDSVLRSLNAAQLRGWFFNAPIYVCFFWIKACSSSTRSFYSSANTGWAWEWKDKGDKNSSFPMMINCLVYTRFWLPESHISSWPTTFNHPQYVQLHLPTKPRTKCAPVWWHWLASNKPLLCKWVLSIPSA